MAAQSGIKIVMASHDLGQVRRLAGDVIFLVRGALCEQGPAADFLDHPTTRGGRRIPARRSRDLIFFNRSTSWRFAFHHSRWHCCSARRLL